MSIQITNNQEEYQKEENYKIELEQYKIDYYKNIINDLNINVFKLSDNEIFNKLNSYSNYFSIELFDILKLQIEEIKSKLYTFKTFDDCTIYYFNNIKYLTINNNGSKFWYNENGELHRDNDLPAIEFSNGN